MNTNPLTTKRLEGMLASLLHHGTWFSSGVTALGLALVMIEAHLGISASRLPSYTTRLYRVHGTMRKLSLIHI